jgi:hypothetical protein
MRRVTISQYASGKHSSKLRHSLFSQCPAGRIVERSDCEGSLKISLACKTPEHQKGDIVFLLPLLSREGVELR